MPMVVPGMSFFIITLLLLVFMLVSPADSVLIPGGKEHDATGPIQTHFKQGEITGLLDAAISTANASLNEIAEIPPHKRTNNNTLLMFEETLARFKDCTLPVSSMGYVYPDEEVAAEGMRAEEQASVFMLRTFSRPDLFNALRNSTPSTPEESRLLNLTLREFRKNGLFLPDDELRKVREMKEKITGLENEYVVNLNNDNTTVEYTADELAGVSPGILSSFQKNENGTYFVTTKYPDYYAIMQNADRSATRKRMLSAFVNRQADKNPPLLQEAISLRKQVAVKLGYQSWVDLRTDGRMAHNEETILAFLSDLKAPLREEVRHELAGLLKKKQESNPEATSLDAWDLLYYAEQVKRQNYAVDANLSTYFPADTVIPGMFNQFSGILGITFSPVDAPVWDPNVTLYRVVNVTDNQTVAYFYMDLFPRPGKYGHTMMCPLKNGRIMQDGTRSVPVSVIIGNMQAPGKDTPSLLSFDDVLGLFHEFGHVLHHSLSRTSYDSLSSANVEMDFIETPSQMVEEWVYDPQVLKAISGKYTDRSEKLPDQMIHNIIASGNVDIGIQHASRYMISAMDIACYHTPDPVDANDLYIREYTDMMGIPPIPGSHQATTIDHYMGGYDAGYYSYLWSKVYALELLDRFNKEGRQNSTTGTKFRHWILEPGNSQDGMDLLKGFLGEEPGLDALFTYLHLTPPKKT